MPAGRPAKFNSAEELQFAIDKYLDEAEIKTVTGLALHLGFESRQSFYDYEEKEEFSYIIKKARLHVEVAYEERLSGNSPTGAIFALKNMGWKDKTEVEQSGNLNMNWNEVKNYGSNPETDKST